MLPLPVPEPWGPAGRSSGVPDWGLGPLSSFFSFPVFSEAISVLQQPPLPCLGSQPGTAGPSLGRGQGTGGFRVTRVAEKQQPPQGLPRSLCPGEFPCPALPVSHKGPDTALAVTPLPGHWRGQARLAFTPQSFSRAVVRQIPPCPNAVVAQGARESVHAARGESGNGLGGKGAHRRRLPREQNLLSPLFPAPSRSCSPRP